MYAGGFRTTAAKKDVAIIRLTEDGYIEAILVTSGAHDQASVMMALRATLLQADDLIFVPESDRSQFVRGISDFVNTPLRGVNSILNTVRDYEIIKDLTSD